MPSLLRLRGADRIIGKTIRVLAILNPCDWTIGKTIRVLAILDPVLGPESIHIPTAGSRPVPTLDPSREPNHLGNLSLK
jgi:hypothetical protein